MKTKNWLVLLASCVALASAPLMGCGDDADPSGGDNNPSTNNPTTNNPTTNNPTTNNPTTNNPTTNNPTTNNPTTNNPTTNNPTTNNPTTNNPTTNNPTTNNPTTNNPTGDCVPNDWYTGQAFNGGNNPHNGGVALDITVDSLTEPLADANLAAVNAAVPATETETMTNPESGDTYESPIVTTADVNIEVTGALVIATGYDQGWSDYDDGNGTLWLQDANDTVHAYQMLDETNQPAEPVQVGDTVSFTVTELTNYKGLPEITGVSNFSIVNSTPEETEVPFSDLTGEDVGIEHYGKLVRVSGEVTEDKGRCGGSDNNPFTCYTLTHGDKEIELRSNADYVTVGSCATFFGPLNSSPSILLDNPEPQLNGFNLSWVNVPR